MHPLLEAFLQAVITLSSIAALVLVMQSTPVRRWGPVVGLVGQPAWLFSTWAHGQFGMFLVSGAFTAIYVWGVWRDWVEPLFEQPEV